MVPLDLIALLLAAASAYALRFSPEATEIRPILTAIDFGDYMATAVLMSFVWIAFFAIAGLYSIRPRRAWSELGRLFVAGTAGAMVLIATVFFQRELTTSRFIVVALWSLSIFFVWFERLFVRVIRHALLRSGIGHKRMVVLGRGKAADDLVNMYRENPILGYTVARHLAGWNASTKKDLERLVSQNKVDEVLLADTELPKEESLDLIAFTEEHHLTFNYLADLITAKFTNIEMRTDGGVPVIEVKRTRLEGWGRIFKRLFDIIISLALIIVLSPLLVAIAIAIKVTTPGPILFRKLPNGKNVMRIGEGGRAFGYMKFRTMVKDAHKSHLDPEFMKKHSAIERGPLMKIKNDPRVTPFGRFLRDWSLDELPELFLVLKGDMSLVGPRPHLPEEVSEYRPSQRKVLTIKPGMSGLAQISGRADLDFDDEVKIDMTYIENWSPALDLYILLKTPFAVLNRKGAY